eukprot:4484964-Prymnesium_polylepis.1
MLVSPRLLRTPPLPPPLRACCELAGRKAFIRRLLGWARASGRRAELTQQAQLSVRRPCAPAR